MKIKYDNQNKKWKECLNDKFKNEFSKNWLRKDTLDFWRHQRMLLPIKAFIQRGEKWLTIGDGRYGTEANFLIKSGVNAHASDLSDELLKISKNTGFINEFSKQNAEDLKFDDNSFDYVLIKESLHHCPRPWLAINEALRVCRRGVILIEPNDQHSNGFNLLKFFINILKKMIRKDNNFSDYNFEEVGNFIFTLNLREVEKYMLAMHYRNLAFIKMNDFYIKGVEEVKVNKFTYKNFKKTILLKSVILIKNILCFFRISQSSLISIVLFKEAPTIKTQMNLKKHNWIFRKLPKNPYLQ